MRRFSLILLIAMAFTTIASAQDNQSSSLFSGKYAIKVQPFTGSYLDQNSHFEKFRPFAPKGVNLGLELPSAQQRPWQQYLSNPTVGVGLSLIDFGHEKVGEAVAMYPYLLAPIVRNKYFNFNFKVGAGLGVVTEHWYTGNVNPKDYDYYGDDVNTIFGCYLNAYLTAGLSANVNITRNVALNGEFGYFHMSNGRTCMPNIGANIIYGGVGVVKTFNADKEQTPIHFDDLPYNWTLNVTGSLGAHRAWMYYPRYLISSFHTGAVYSVSNWYGLGVGFDAFYNGAVNSGTGRGLYCNGVLFDKTKECNTCNGEYSLKDKVRFGISLNNEFRFGLLTGIVDWGVYLRNPSRHLYQEWHEINYENGGVQEERPLFYKANGAGNEEAFHYIRFGLKARVWDNLYLQASAKTHLHICEYVEFGLGYQIPFLKKSLRKQGQSPIFHYSKGWWK